MTQVQVLHTCAAHRKSNGETMNAERRRNDSLNVAVDLGTDRQPVCRLAKRANLSSAHRPDNGVTSRADTWHSSALRQAAGLEGFPERPQWRDNEA